MLIQEHEGFGRRLPVAGRRGSQRSHPIACHLDSAGREVPLLLQRLPGLHGGFPARFRRAVASLRRGLPLVEEGELPVDDVEALLSLRDRAHRGTVPRVGGLRSGHGLPPEGLRLGAELRRFPFPRERGFSLRLGRLHRLAHREAVSRGPRGFGLEGGGRVAVGLLRRPPAEVGAEGVARKRRRYEGGPECVRAGRPHAEVARNPRFREGHLCHRLEPRRLGRVVRDPFRRVHARIQHGGCHPRGRTEVRGHHLKCGHGTAVPSRACLSEVVKGAELICTACSDAECQTRRLLKLVPLPPPHAVRYPQQAPASPWSLPTAVSPLQRRVLGARLREGVAELSLVLIRSEREIEVAHGLLKSNWVLTWCFYERRGK